VTPIPTLLEAWRAADRRWEATPPDDPGYRAACIDVLRSWLAYHAAADPGELGEFALVADDERRYVVVSDGIEATLGYAPESVLGLRIEDLAAPSVVEGTPERWREFVLAGRQDGTFELVARDGAVLRVRYQARAHFPIAGFHLSRLWRAGDEA
jgi:PAS domain-containing protein